MTVFFSIVVALLLTIVILQIQLNFRKTITLWFAVDRDGTACLYFSKPHRENASSPWFPTDEKGFIEADCLKPFIHDCWMRDPVKITFSI